jgi:hypothetical protein
MLQDWNHEKGKAAFKLSPDGKTFHGSWRHGSGHGDWTMRRVRGHTFEAKVDSLVEVAGVHPNGPGGAVLLVEGARSSS